MESTIVNIWQIISCGIAIALLTGMVIAYLRAQKILSELSRERDLLQTLLDTIPDQIYFKDTHSRFIRVSQAVARTLGVTCPAEAIGKADGDFFALEDAQAFRADDMRVLSSRQPLRDRIERGTVNGVETWMSTTKAPLFDNTGNAIGLVGISRDITDRIRAERNLRECVSKARCILWNARVTHANGKFNWRIDFHSSDHLRRELGLEQSEWPKRIHPDQLKIMDETSATAMLGGAEGYNQEFWITTRGGETRWLNEDVRIAKVAELEWDLVGVALDITERKLFEQQLAAANEKLARLASEDVLTGLHNRRAILELAEAEWLRWERFTSVFSMLIVDVDNFKRINDIHSHQEGDRALRHVAAQLKASVRKVDSVGRFGGEEFVIVLPETTQDGAEHLAQKVLNQLRNAPIELGGVTVHITVSIGASTALSTDKNIAGLLHRADCALLLAKRAGKNCAVMATATSVTPTSLPDLGFKS